MGAILELITHASSVSLRELHARTGGDVEYTASELAVLYRQGLVHFQGSDGAPIKWAAEAAHDKLRGILGSGDESNRVYVQPTTRGLRNVFA